MDANDVKLAVSHFLDLVANGREGERENVKALVVALDMLAWMQHVAGEEATSPDPSHEPAAPAAPEREYDKMRGLVAQQFPSFGYYSTPANPADQNGEAEMLAGDAGADLANIACELYEIAWLFQNQRDAEALRAFSDGYERRWRSLLRTLQWYIERRRRDAWSGEAP
jgi:hypothetical protein